MKDPLVPLSDVFEVILKIERKDSHLTADSLIVHLLRAFTGPTPVMPPKPEFHETSEELN